MELTQYENVQGLVGIHGAPEMVHDSPAASTHPVWPLGASGGVAERGIFTLLLPTHACVAVEIDCLVATTTTA